ncbi:MAG: gamma-glutamyl-gamma-aminobutyrate hydrolase family protein [Actinomycetota bacterium]
MHPPLIGITGRHRFGREVVGFGGILEPLDINMYLLDYARGVAAAGGLPVHLPLIDDDPAALVRRLDGLVLSGGGDLDPARYGADREPDCGDEDVGRDAYELGLVAAALDIGCPVLGICRGLQVVNVHHGGTLNQHVPSHARYDVAPNTITQKLETADGSILQQLYGPTVDVNSLHHQTVAEVGDGLTVTAVADDGTVEGIERGDDVLAIQWHPEMLDTRDSDPAFAWLIARASAR